MREFSQLALQQRNLVMSMQDQNNNPEGGKPNQLKLKQVTDKDNSERVKEVSQLQIKAQVESINASNKRRGRRASTGSIETTAFFSRQNSSNSELSTITETNDITYGNKGAGNDEHTVDQPGLGGESIPEGRNERDDIANSTNDSVNMTTCTNNITEGAGVEELAGANDNDMHNNADIKKNTKRKKSAATIKTSVSDPAIARRLDRRPTLPNIAIPFNYGN